MLSILTSLRLIKNENASFIITIHVALTVITINLQKVWFGNQEGVL